MITRYCIEAEEEAAKTFRDDWRQPERKGHTCDIKGCRRHCWNQFGETSLLEQKKKTITKGEPSYYQLLTTNCYFLNLFPTHHPHKIKFGLL